MNAYITSKIHKIIGMLWMIVSGKVPFYEGYRDKYGDDIFKVKANQNSTQQKPMIVGTNFKPSYAQKAKLNNSQRRNITVRRPRSLSRGPKNIPVRFARTSSKNRRRPRSRTPSNQRNFGNAKQRNNNTQRTQRSNRSISYSRSQRQIGKNRGRFNRRKIFPKGDGWYTIQRQNRNPFLDKGNPPNQNNR